MTAVTFPYLTSLVLVPAVGAAVVAIVPKKAVATWFHEALGIVVTVVTLAVAAAVLVSDHNWATGLGIHWSLGIDGISLFLVVLTAVLFPLTMLGARARRDTRSFVAWVLLLESACMGSFVSLDLILFFLFFELTLVPSYFLIGGWGFARRGYAAIKFFVYTFAGSAFLLVGIVAIAFIHQSQTGVLTFELPALMHTHLSGTEGVLLFCAFTAAFAVKAPRCPPAGTAWTPSRCSPRSTRTRSWWSRPSV
jgi:NADH-quinone oxidoreductase subunit M